MGKGRTQTERMGVGVGRIASLDVMRGVAMILMAIDHVRVYAGVPPWGDTYGVYFTRWVTNFSAPTFVFLAGTSAYLYGRRVAKKGELARFLALRGLWLILLELTVLRLAWTFNFDYAHYMLAGVIWMIGWCMILLAGAVYLPTRVVGVIGLIIVFGHNVADLFQKQLEQAFGSAGPNWWLRILYFGGKVQLGGSGPPLFILYVILPWAGLMFAGYAFGKLMENSAERRRKILLGLGAAMIVAFVVLRVAGIYGDPNPWQSDHSLFGFLGTTKYPVSLEFVLMTLGPMFVLGALAEGWRGKLEEVVQTFGRVPMFFYLLHIPLIHFAACVVSLIREHRVDPWLLGNHPMAPGRAPDGYMWSLGLLYLVYAICMVVLYFACRWYSELRRRNKSAWLKWI